MRDVLTNHFSDNTPQSKTSMWRLSLCWCPSQVTFQVSMVERTEPSQQLITWLVWHEILNRPWGLIHPILEGQGPYLSAIVSRGFKAKFAAEHTRCSPQYKTLINVSSGALQKSNTFFARNRFLEPVRSAKTPMRKVNHANARPIIVRNWKCHP